TQPCQPAVTTALQEQILIFGIAEPGIVGIVAEPGRAPAPARMRQRKTHKGPRHDVLMMEPDRHLAHEFAATSEDHSATAQKIKLSILTQAIDLPCQPLRKADVVGIHPRDELAPRERDRLIETRRKAGGGGFTDETN